MRILTFKVDDRVGEAYNKSTADERRKMNDLINTLLGEVVRKKQTREFVSLMDKISAETAVKGLTPKKLGELMEWDKETMVNLFGEDYEQNA